MSLYDELAAIVKVLEDAELDYALRGGLAVMLHGYVRATADIDILIRQSDVTRVKQVLAEIGFDVSSGEIPFDVGTAKERLLHRVSKSEAGEILTVDLMVVTPVLEPAWENRNAYIWQGVTIRVVSRSGLRFMKSLAGRLKDQLDIQELGLDEDEADE